MIFFPKTRLALEIIGAMDEPISSATRSCLLSLLLYGAKQNRLLERQVGASHSARESMLIAARSVASNATAGAELCRVATLDFPQSIRVMLSLERATSTVAERHGLRKLLNSMGGASRDQADPDEAELDLEGKTPATPTFSDQALNVASEADATAVPAKKQPSQEDFWRAIRAKGVSQSQIKAAMSSSTRLEPIKSGGACSTKDGGTDPTG